MHAEAAETAGRTLIKVAVLVVEQVVKSQLRDQRCLRFLN